MPCTHPKIQLTVEALASEHDEPVPPCWLCGSAELCHPNCNIAPWNLEPT